MPPRPQINKDLVIPIFSLIGELEESLISDVMVARMHKDKNLKLRIMSIQKILDISRRYLMLGFEKKGYFSYLRALALYIGIQ